MLQDFLFNVSYVKYLGNSGFLETNGSLGDRPDGVLASLVDDAAEQVYSALCDSVDTRRSLLALRDLIQQANTAAFGFNVPLSRLLVELPALWHAGRLIVTLLRIFGCADSTLLAYNSSSPVPRGRIVAGGPISDLAAMVPLSGAGTSILVEDFTQRKASKNIEHLHHQRQKSKNGPEGTSRDEKEYSNDVTTSQWLSLDFADPLRISQSLLSVLNATNQFIHSLNCTVL
ncbi:unnamed protein product [Protopolystoma xenopodis]|uniref:Uncharacterized protein n=1 Tax=Protopolystoma xenopodis TaxID=117903 RepID=A0A448XHA4_9PLAT|nr:unnamed protein product [Protopolystoma xenopodis]